MNFLKRNWLIIILSFIVLFAITYNFYNFYYLKNDFFTIETSCDAKTEKCFVRSCDDVECPPNEYTVYKMYLITARNFENCSDDSCANICTNNIDSCELIPCGDNPEDTCLGPNEQ